MTDSRLSLPDFSALMVLAIEAREISNSELKQRHKMTIDGSRRIRLNELKLVESVKPGRAYVHVLTDAGWVRLAEDLRAGRIPPQSGSSGAMAGALLGWLPRFMERNDLRLSEVFQPDEDEAGPGDPSDDLEARIRAAYSRVAAEPGTWVTLTELRRVLGEAPKDRVDEALVRMERLPDVNLVPESNQKTLTPEDREAAVIIGAQAKHLLWIGRP
ncbi:hypothetical protein ITP53_05420 [Nonomuraea sp. K274]|uniref:Uncharacterized protein n=1 Tax=Nonomuraea cypriaca TaxID=1187855 RepID=A0A931A4X1_9ACTN|nr:hypothetical protein [Nonomuraea cypriaca]MBF8185188.1 hypothetical protein [Nonomuraea cypriaca]